MRIIFIGYMGAGKTTIGRRVAMRLNLPFYDLDWYIETRMHSSVSEIFAKSGEAAFRQMEHNMLHEVAEFEDVVLSCGGGTPCFFDNIDYMNRQAKTIYLKASAEVLYSHLRMGRTKRPLLEGKNEEEMLAYIRQQVKKREAYYSQAHHTLSVDLLDNYAKINQSVDLVLDLLQITT